MIGSGDVDDSGGDTYPIGSTMARDGRGKLRVGVIGYGYWGSKHVRVLAAMPDVAVVVADGDSARLIQARRAFPNMRLARSVDEVLREVDAIVVATPPRTHAEIAQAAVDAGCHVMVEKPLGVSVAECQALIDSAEKAGVVLMVGHTFEYNAAVWKLRELVSTGELGNTRYIDTARLNLGLYQKDVNVVWDLAAHDVSILNFLLGRLPATVSAWGHNHATDGLEDVAHLQLRYEDSPLSAYLHVSWLDPCKVRRVTVVGSEKMAVYNDVATNERIRVYDVGVAPSSAVDDLQAMPMSYRYGDIVSPYIPFEEPLGVEDGHFIDCARHDARPLSDGASGLAVVRVLEAASVALSTGAEVSVDGIGNRLDRTDPAHGRAGRDNAAIGSPDQAIGTGAAL